MKQHWQIKFSRIQQESKTDEDWKAYGEEGKPAWCYYDNDPANGEKYGILYNWYATIDPRGLAPKRWYVPSDKEWTSLIIYLGGSTLAGEKLKFAGKGAKSTKVAHEINFNALPGGYRKFNGGFTQLGFCGFWWSSTENTPGKAWSR